MPTLEILKVFLISAAFRLVTFPSFGDSGLLWKGIAIQCRAYVCDVT
jgi:hypothetical protein